MAVGFGIDRGYGLNDGLGLGLDVWQGFVNGGHPPPLEGVVVVILARLSPESRLLFSGESHAWKARKSCSPRNAGGESHARGAVRGSSVGAPAAIPLSARCISQMSRFCCWRSERVSNAPYTCVCRTWWPDSHFSGGKVKEETRACKRRRPLRGLKKLATQIRAGGGRSGFACLGRGSPALRNAASACGCVFLSGWTASEILR